MMSNPYKVKLQVHFRLMINTKLVDGTIREDISNFSSQATKTKAFRCTFLDFQIGLCACCRTFVNIYILELSTQR